MAGATAPAIFFGLGVRLRALEGKRADSARTARGPAVLLAEGPCFYCQTATQFHCPTAGHPLPIRLWNAIGHANRWRLCGSFPYDSLSAGQAPDGDALGARAGVVG